MGRKGKKGKSAKGAQKNVIGENEEINKAPHSFVIYRGKLGTGTHELLRDVRKVMEPFTASNIKVQKQNVLKDFISISGQLNVTHMIVFTQTSLSVYMKVVRLPRGPTLTFKVEEYSLARDVVNSLKKPISYSNLYMHHPLVVLNDFPESSHMKLTENMFQDMFPPMNVNTVKLNNVRRCAAFCYQEDTDKIEFRHYAIKTVAKGVSKPIKKLIKGVPDLSKYNDIAEYIENPGYMSESEAEQDNESNQVILPQPINTRGVLKGEEVAIRLIELGPRLTLTLVKMEEGTNGGRVLYHNRIIKTEEEIEYLQEKKRKQEKVKEKKKEEQKLNVSRKAKERNKSSTKEYDAEDELDSGNDEKTDHSKRFDKSKKAPKPALKRPRQDDNGGEPEDSPSAKKQKPFGKFKKMKSNKKEEESGDKKKPFGKFINKQRNKADDSKANDGKLSKMKQIKKKDPSKRTITETLAISKLNKLKRMKLKAKKQHKKK